MKNWQLSGIIYNDSRSRLILPSGKLLKAARKERHDTKISTISKAVQSTLRRMTEVIALF